MSDTTYEPAGESAVDVAQHYDFDGPAEPAQPDAPAPVADVGDEWQGPSPEEWEHTQQMLQHYGGIVEQHQAQAQQQAYEARVAELRDQLDELEWTDPDEYERVVEHIRLAPHLERIGQLESYIAQHQRAEAVADGEDEALDILAELGFEGDDAVDMYDEADARFENAVATGLEMFGGDAAAFWSAVAQQAGVAYEDGPRWLAEQALERIANESRFEARIGEARSLTEMVREAPAYANPGTTTTIRSERPESLKDIARRYTQGT